MSLALHCTDSSPVIANQTAAALRREGKAAGVMEVVLMRFLHIDLAPDTTDRYAVVVEEDE